MTREPRLTAGNRDEWFYRSRFEQSGEDRWLLEYGLSRSAWRSSWFRRVLRTNVLGFVRWCHYRKISLGKMAKWLNEKGPKPPRGTAWHKSSLRFFLVRSSEFEQDVRIKKVIRLLKGFRWAEKNQQPWIDQVTKLSDSRKECARRVWEMYNLLLPAFRALSSYVVRCQREYERVSDRFQRRGTGMQRRGEFAFHFLGSPSLRTKSLSSLVLEAKTSSKDVSPPWVEHLEQFDRAVPQFLDFQPTRLDLELLGRHKTTEALLRILCRLEGISTRTARRFKDLDVQ